MRQSFGIAHERIEDQRGGDQGRREMECMVHAEMCRVAGPANQSLSRRSRASAREQLVMTARPISSPTSVCLPQYRMELPGGAAITMQSVPVPVAGAPDRVLAIPAPWTASTRASVAIWIA